MLDIPLLIFEYDETDGNFGFIPPCPDDAMPDMERERLDEELYELIDCGAFDPKNEIIEPA